MIDVEKLVATSFPDGALKRYFSRPLVFCLQKLFRESEFKQFEKKYPDERGIDFVDKALKYFEFGYKADNEELDNIPSQGRVVVVSNHPIGSLDGLAFLHMVYKIRPDVKIVANQVLAKLGVLAPLLLPVDNMGRNTAKLQLKAIQKHLHSEGAVIVFPSGVVSRWGKNGILDTDWQTGFLRFSQSTRAPILPVHIEGRCSTFFYFLSVVARKVSTLWLVPEMFKQRGKLIRFRIGKIIPCKAYEKLELPAKELVSRFKEQVYLLPKKNTPVYQDLFSSYEAVATPENPELVTAEFDKQAPLGETSDGKQIYLVDYREDSAIIRELGRLREMTFRMVEEGTGKSRDLDEYDHHYQHLILWDPQDSEIVGAYRICSTSKTIKEQGLNSLYSTRIYKYTDQMQPFFEQGLELGRSFVQPKYWGKRSLDYLWFGIGALLAKNPQYRYLFGAVSISDGYPTEAKDLIIHFYSTHFPAQAKLVEALYPYEIEPEKALELKKLFPGDNYQTEFALLKRMMSKLGCSIPTLYKQYAELGEPGGVSICCSGLDIHFSNAVDGFVMVDVWKLKQAKRDRYLQVESLTIKNDGSFPAVS